LFFYGFKNKKVEFDFYYNKPCLHFFKATLAEGSGLGEEWNMTKAMGNSKMKIPPQGKYSR
jgi:hypothetical protein